MNPIKLNTRRLDQTVHHTVLDHEQLKALVLDAVTKAAVVTVDCSAVRVDQLYLSNSMGSTGTEYRATCTIVVDHQINPTHPDDAAGPPLRSPRRWSPGEGVLYPCHA